MFADLCTDTSGEIVAVTCDGLTCRSGARLWAFARPVLGIRIASVSGVVVCVGKGADSDTIQVCTSEDRVQIEIPEIAHGATAPSYPLAVVADGLDMWVYWVQVGGASWVGREVMRRDPITDVGPFPCPVPGGSSQGWWDFVGGQPVWADLWRVRKVGGIDYSAAMTRGMWTVGQAGRGILAYDEAGKKHYDLGATTSPYAPRLAVSAAGAARVVVPGDDVTVIDPITRPVWTGWPETPVIVPEFVPAGRAIGVSVFGDLGELPGEFCDAEKDDLRAADAAAKARGVLRVVYTDHAGFVVSVLQDGDAALVFGYPVDGTPLSTREMQIRADVAACRRRGKPTGICIGLYRQLRGDGTYALDEQDVIDHAAMCWRVAVETSCQFVWIFHRLRGPVTVDGAQVWDGIGAFSSFAEAERRILAATTDRAYFPQRAPADATPASVRIASYEPRLGTVPLTVTIETEAHGSAVARFELRTRAHGAQDWRVVSTHAADTKTVTLTLAQPGVVDIGLRGLDRSGKPIPGAETGALRYVTALALEPPAVPPLDKTALVTVDTPAWVTAFMRGHDSNAPSPRDVAHMCWRRIVWHWTAEESRAEASDGVAFIARGELRAVPYTYEATLEMADALASMREVAGGTWTPELIAMWMFELLVEGRRYDDLVVDAMTVTQ